MNCCHLAAVTLLTWSAAAVEVRRNDGASWPTVHGDLIRADLQDGSLVWKSRKLQGLSVRDYSPVICRGLVFITTNPVKDFHTLLGQHQEMLVRRTGLAGKENRYRPATPKEVEKEQQRAGLFFIDRIRGQNIVGDTAANFTANPVALTDMEVSECFVAKEISPSSRSASMRSGLPPADLGPNCLENPDPDFEPAFAS
jgi:hypothetical protein